jgi:hypothetical protein
MVKMNQLNRNNGMVRFILVLVWVCAFPVLGAFDQADNDPYPTQGSASYQNAGTGFMAWEPSATENSGGEYLGNALMFPNTYSWEISQTRAMGRGLETPLAQGQWSFLAQHDANNTHFSGFNLKSTTNNNAFATDELLRFGMDEFNGGGLYLSTDAGQSYTFLDCGWVDGAGDTLQYTLDWNATAGTYSLSVSNLTETLSSTFSGNLAISGTAVSMLGTGIFGTSTDEHLNYDQLTVIPEPAIWSIILLTAGSLIAIRRVFNL